MSCVKPRSKHTRDGFLMFYPDLPEELFRNPDSAAVLHRPSHIWCDGMRGCGEGRLSTKVLWLRAFVIKIPCHWMEMNAKWDCSEPAFLSGKAFETALMALRYRLTAAGSQATFPFSWIFCSDCHLWTTQSETCNGHQVAGGLLFLLPALRCHTCLAQPHDYKTQFLETSFLMIYSMHIHKYVPHRLHIAGSTLHAWNVFCSVYWQWSLFPCTPNLYSLDQLWECEVIGSSGKWSSLSQDFQGSWSVMCKSHVLMTSQQLKEKV